MTAIRPPVGAAPERGTSVTGRCLSVAERTDGVADCSLPRVFEFDGDGSIGSTVLGMRKPIREALLQHGAVLLRGLSVCDGQRLTEVLSQLAIPVGHKAYFDPLDRKETAPHVFAIENVDLLGPHIEMSYAWSRPAQIAVSCIAPADRGGETTLCDFASVFAALPDRTRSRLENAFLIYRRPLTRAYLESRFPNANVTGISRSDVEAENENYGGVLEWGADGSATVRTEVPAFILHPETGHRMFNFQFYWGPWAGAFAREWRRRQRGGAPAMVGPRQRVAAVRAAVLRRIGRPSPSQAGVDVSFADGVGLSDSELEDLASVVCDQNRSFSWRAGDMLVIDNARVAHGKLPHEGKRELLIAHSRHFSVRAG